MRQCSMAIAVFWLLFSLSEAQETQSRLVPLFRVIDLNVGESAALDLPQVGRVDVKLLDLNEQLDEVSQAVRRAEVTVAINGETITLVSATYNLPQPIGNIQIDCSITRGYNDRSSKTAWGLDKDARLRIWPGDSKWLRTGTFVYPVKQAWFATDTQMANDPVYVDGKDQTSSSSIYYHSGLDIGGSEGLVDVVAATDGLVVSVGDAVHKGYSSDTPVSPRYDVVYVVDQRGWFYRYSHLKEIAGDLLPGRRIKMGDPIGVLGKEGGSGGWSHLHFEIKCRQPSGKWGTQEGYAFLWEAYQRQYDPDVIAVARPHHLIWAGTEITLDGSKSWSKRGKPAEYGWTFHDGTTASGALVKKTYPKPGRFSEILKITDAQGNIDYDFAVVIVADRQHPERPIASIHPNFFPTESISVDDEVTFKVRSFKTRDRNSVSRPTETWDFGDGTPTKKVSSDGNAIKLDPDGYATKTHRFTAAGDYVVRVDTQDPFGRPATGHLHVRVMTPPKQDTGDRNAPTNRPTAQATWPDIERYFMPPAEFADDYGQYASPMIFADGTRVEVAKDWTNRRAELVGQWQQLLGEWPPLIDEPRLDVISTVQRDGFVQKQIRFQWTPDQWTTGYLCIPEGADQAAAVVAVFYEPETAVGLGKEDRDFAYQLSRRGFVTLSIGTTEATAAKTYALYYPSIDQVEVQPLSMLAYAAANAWHVLAAQPEVDPQRIGIVGHSFGGKWAMFAGCLFDRFAAVAVSDPGIVFDTHPSINYWEPWYLGWHPRPWRKRGVISVENPARGLYPELLKSDRDLHELHALLAPRPFLVSGGAVDPPSRWQALNHLIAINRLLGYENRVGMTNRPDHSPNQESNEVIYAFFDHFLNDR